MRVDKIEINGVNQADLSQFPEEIRSKIGYVSKGDEYEIELPDEYYEKYETAMWRFKTILEIDNLLTGIDSLIQSETLSKYIPDETDRIKVRSAWNHSQVIRRHSPIIAVLQGALKAEAIADLTDEDIDTIFQRANKIEI